MTGQPRLPLSWRLGLAISGAVLVVMIVVSWPQRLAHFEEMRASEMSWLRALASPTVELLERSASDEEIGRAVDDFRVRLASVHHVIPAVRVERGGDHLEFGVPNPSTSMIELSAGSRRASAQDHFRLLVEDEGVGVADASAYWIHVFVTALALIVSLVFTLQIWIARPLSRLLEGIRLMEMGYWQDVPTVRGVWELEWLRQRFVELSESVEQTVRSLLEAERRGSEQIAGRSAAGQLVTHITGDAPAELEEGSDLEDLRRALAELSEAEARSRSAQALAARLLVEGSAAAERAGDMDLKRQIEDKALEILDAAANERLQKKLSALSPALAAESATIEGVILEAMTAESIPLLHLQMRRKGLGSIWRKMQQKGLELGQIHDLIAFRIVVEDTEDCYRCVHALHSRFEPIVGRFKDYIAKPKPNGYRSIHTSVRAPSGLVFEVQIRSRRMHLDAETGDCSHWRYRLGRCSKSTPDAGPPKNSGRRPLLAIEGQRVLR